MAEMRVSIREIPQLPEGCVQLVGGRVICDKPQIMSGCKLLEDNNLDCSDAGYETFVVFLMGISCYQYG